MSVPRPRICRAAVVIALGCSLLGVVPSIVESAASPRLGRSRRKWHLHGAARRLPVRDRPGDRDEVELAAVAERAVAQLCHPAWPGLADQRLGGCPDPATAPEWSGGTYTVRRGDYLYAIARATGTKLSSLLSLNGLSLNSVIQPGQVLRTSGSAGAANPATAPEWSGRHLHGAARRLPVCDRPSDRDEAELAAVAERAVAQLCHPAWPGAEDLRARASRLRRDLHSGERGLLVVHRPQVQRADTGSARRKRGDQVDDDSSWPGHRPPRWCRTGRGFAARVETGGCSATVFIGPVVERPTRSGRRCLAGRPRRVPGRPAGTHRLGQLGAVGYRSRD